ncbi:MAG: hypothetical protein AB9846_00320 [Tenuifilaceae bacterium]
MIAYTNPITQKVFLILKPLTGEMMAQGILKVQFNHLGINQDALKTGDLPKLADEIQKGLIAFIGKDAAGQVAAKIRSVA